MVDPGHFTAHQSVFSITGGIRYYSMRFLSSILFMYHFQFVSVVFQSKSETNFMDEQELVTVPK
jgi:hypothetical protein